MDKTLYDNGKATGDRRENEAATDPLAACASPDADGDTRFEAAALRARKLSAAQLDYWLEQYRERDLVIAGAIRCVMAERKVAQDKDAELRRLFA